MKSLALTLSLLLSAGALHAQSAQSSAAQQPDTRARADQPASESQARSSAEIAKDQLKVSEDRLHADVTDANKASKVIGMEIRNLQNERIGKVKDIVLDLQAGRVGYAVMNAGGGFFGGGKLIAVPLDALTLAPGQDHFVMDAPKDRLAAAPGFSDENWPSLDSGGDRTIGLSASTDESTQQKAREEAEDDNDETNTRMRTDRDNATTTNAEEKRRPDQR